jgi:hypothetical protein
MIEQSAVEGISRLYEWGGIVTVLILNLLALVSFSIYLVKRNTALNDKFITAYIENTKAIQDLTSVVKMVIGKADL